MGAEGAERAQPRPQNLARATLFRTSWSEDFAVGPRCCAAPTCALASPHAWQRVELPAGAFPELDALPMRRELTSESSRRAYHRRQHETKSSIHWGQRKLFIAELEFISEFFAAAPDAKPLIVYAGAAPGAHLDLLCRLFPAAAFEAFDPRPFDASVRAGAGPPNLRVAQEFFTDAVAQRLGDQAARAGRQLLFLSDIRTADWERDAPEEHDALLVRDMEAQRRWCEIMQPELSLLKFRLPYTEGATEYLAGELRLPVWGPQTTTECRLLIRRGADGSRSKTETYDHTAVSEQLFFFNTVARASIYPRLCHDGTDAGDGLDTIFRGVGLDRCFDCTREVQVLSLYLSQSQAGCPRRGTAWAEAVADLSCKISESCGRGRLGLLTLVPPRWETGAAPAAAGAQAGRKRNRQW